MVCKKCGRSFNDGMNTCPFCGVGQENQINIKKLENELENLKMEDKSSSFYNEDNYNKPMLDIDDIIDDLEELKVKEKDEDDIPVPRVEPVSDSELFELISDIKENKELFVTDRSQYQYKSKNINKEKEVIDINEDDIDIIDVTPEPKTLYNDYDEDIFEEENINDSYDNTPQHTDEIGIYDLYNKQRLYNPDEVIIRHQEEIELPQVLSEKPTTEKEINYIKPRSYKKEIIISSIIFVIVTFVTIFLIYKYMFSPKIKMFKNINDNYTKIQNIIDKYSSNFTGIFKYDDVSISSTSTISTTENANVDKEIINIKYIENKLDKTQYYEYSNLNNSKTEFEKMFIMNNKFYSNKENKTDEFYITDGRFISLLNNNNRENTEYLLDILIDSIKSNISDTDFKIKTIKKQKEYTLKIDEKKYSKIYSNYLNKIKEDEKAIEMLINTFGYSNVELMTNLNSKLKELESKTSSKVILTYKFYTNEDKKVIKHYLEYDNYDVTLLDDGKKIELTINKDREEVMYLKIKSVDNNINRHSITLNYDNYELLGDFYEENNKIIFNYQKTHIENENDIEIVNFVLKKGENEGNKYTNDISIAYQKTENSNIVSKKIETTNVIEANTKIPDIDITDVNKISSMDDNLRNELKEKFSIFIK